MTLRPCSSIESRLAQTLFTVPVIHEEEVPAECLYHTCLQQAEISPALF